MNPNMFNHQDALNFLKYKVLGMDFPEAPDFDMFYSIASPQQLPFHRCKRANVVPYDYLFFVDPRNEAMRIETQNGFYRMIGAEEPLADPPSDYICGYVRRFRFFYNNDGNDPADALAPIASNWVVEEFRLKPDYYKNPDFKKRASNLALCKVKKDNYVIRDPDIHPPCFEFESHGSELLDQYLKKNILGLYINLDPIPSFEVFSVPSPDDLPFYLFEGTRTRGVWHFFCHLSYKHGTEGGETKVGFYQPEGHYKPIYGKTKKLLGYSRILTYYHENSNGESRKSKWTIKEFKVDPKIVEVHLDDAFTNELVSDLAVYKVVNNEETRERLVTDTDTDTDADTDSD